MGVGDWLEGVDQGIDNFLGGLIPAYGDYVKADEKRIKKQHAAGVNDSWYSSATGNGAAVLGGIGKGIEKVESIPYVGGAVEFALDLPNRSWDTAFNVASAADADAADNGGTGFGTFFNASSWSKAWSSWGTPEHVSAGDIVSGMAQDVIGGEDPNAGLNPLNARDAKIIQDHADNTWYGSLTQGVTDLTAGFVVPGVGAASSTLKAARDANTVGTIGKAEGIADTLKATTDVDALKVTKGRTIARGLVGKPQEGTDAVARLRDTMRHGNDKFGQDTQGWVNYLRPMMEGTPDESVVKLADYITQTNKLDLDPDVMLRDQMNGFLSLMGSTAARAELASSSPLLAKHLQNVGEAPREVGLTAKLQEHVAAEGLDRFDPGRVIDEFYDDTSDVAERAALDDELARAADDAAAAKKLREEIAALKPRLRGGPDQQHMLMLREQARERVRRLTAQHRAASQELKSAKGEVKRAYKGQQAALGGLRGRLTSQDTSRLTGASRQLGRSEQAAKEADFRAAGSRVGVDTAAARAAAANLRADRKANTAAGREFDRERRSALFDADEQAGLDAAQGDLSAAQELLGGAKARYDALAGELAGAKADKELFESTPLGDELEFAAWRELMAESVRAAKDAKQTHRWVDAEANTIEGAIKAKREAAKGARGRLSAENDTLNTIFALGDDQYIGQGRLAPSVLDQLKTRFRNRVGESYLFSAGPANTTQHLIYWPTRVAALIGTPRARGGINTNEVAVGAQELGESMKRSGVFSPDEVRANVNRFYATGRDQRQVMVGDVHDQMVARIAEREFDMSPEQAQEFLRLAKKGYGAGRAHLAKAANDQVDADVVTVRADDGGLVKFDGGFLRSHLADTVGFIDPGVVRDVLRQHAGSGQSIRQFFAQSERGYNALMQVWKHGVLLRPGLAVRAMLDTGIRANALIGAAQQFVDTVNGVQHLARNRGNGALVRLGLRDEKDVIFHALGTDSFRVDVGGGAKTEFLPYQDRAHMAAMRSALQKGGNPTRAFRSSTSKHESSLRGTMTSWEMKKPESPHWALGYIEYAKVLGASPTARKLMRRVGDDGIPGEKLDEFLKEIWDEPGVRDEYRTMVGRYGVDKDEFLQEMVRQVDLMFPTKKVRDLFLDGRFDRRGGTDLVKELFPEEYRFRVPGPEMSLDGSDLSTHLKNGLDRLYDTLLDKPDFWLARHPVFVRRFKDQVRAEVDAAKARLADGEHLSADQLRSIDARARTVATQEVRRTFYDNTRFTGAHQVMTKISPFFMPWEDAMMSWSRLLYDNPKVAVRLAGLWNAPDAVVDAIPGAQVVDYYGNPVAAGEDPEYGKYYQFPVKIPGLPGITARWNKNALNSIAQGNVPWLPGFGPREQILATELLGRVLPHDVALDMVGTDSPLGKLLLKSVFYQGEVPDASAGAQVKQLFPSWARNLYDGVWGNNYGENVGYNLNAQYLAAQKSGKPFNVDKAFVKAQKSAYTAAIVRSLSTGLIGMSGNAVVDGQFYIDQMHNLNALSKDQLKQMGYSNPEQAFTAMFPEASELDWSLSRNETGINATVKAQKAAGQLKGLIAQDPEYAWFILGGSNVGGKFSRTAYDQQLADRYGWQKLGRTRQDPKEQIEDAVVSQGWNDYTHVMDQLAQLRQEYGALPEWDTVESAVKDEFMSYMADVNPEWVEAKNTMSNKRDTFFKVADRIASKSKVKGRTDMVAYRQYREARQEILGSYGLKSLSGTSANSAQARYAIRQVGDLLASENLGFRQAWQRILSGEVEPRPGDKELLGEALGGATS